MTYRDDLAAAEAVIAQLRDELAETRARIAALEAPPSASSTAADTDPRRTTEKASFLRRLALKLLESGKTVLPDSEEKETKPLLMSPDKFRHASKDKKVTFMTAQAVRLASVLANPVTKPPTGPEDMFIVGSFEQRSVRVRVHRAFGGTTLEMRGGRGLPSLHLEVNEKAIRPAVEPLPLDEWEKRDGQRQKRFFSRRVHAEARPEDLKEIEAAWNRLPSAQRDAVLEHLEREPEGSLYTGGDSLRWSSSTLLFQEDAANALEQRLRLLSELIKCSEDGSSAPRDAESRAGGGET